MLKKDIMDKIKRAILVVSFGTSYEETRKKNIERIEEDIRQMYPGFCHYRAWTSGRIIRKLFQRDGIRIPDVRDAMEQMEADGITEVIVQPTHVINGIENEKMTEDILAYRDHFLKIIIVAPLLTTDEDRNHVIQVMAGAFRPDPKEALIFMGHGTEHFANIVYGELDLLFKNMGHQNIFMGTVEAEPTVRSLVEKMKKLHYRKVILSPFMIVAGDHATNDLAGDEQDSWKSIFEREGFEVSCVLKGLGEYEGIRQIFCGHVAESVRKLQEQI